MARFEISNTLKWVQSLAEQLVDLLLISHVLFTEDVCDLLIDRDDLLDLGIG